MSGSPEPDWRTLVDFTVPGQAGAEHLALERVVGAVRELSLPPENVEELKAAVVQAMLNVRRPTLPIAIRVLTSAAQPVTGLNLASGQLGGAVPGPAGHQGNLASPAASKGWGFFLVERTVDEPGAPGADIPCVIEVFLYPEGNCQIASLRPALSVDRNLQCDRLKLPPSSCSRSPG